LVSIAEFPTTHHSLKVCIKKKIAVQKKLSSPTYRSNLKLWESCQLLTFAHPFGDLETSRWCSSTPLFSVIPDLIFQPWLALPFLVGGWTTQLKNTNQHGNLPQISGRKWKVFETNNYSFILSFLASNPCQGHFLFFFAMQKNGCIDWPSTTLRLWSKDFLGQAPPSLTRRCWRRWHRPAFLRSRWCYVKTMPLCYTVSSFTNKRESHNMLTSRNTFCSDAKRVKNKCNISHVVLSWTNSFRMHLDVQPWLMSKRRLSSPGLCCTGFSQVGFP